MEHLFGCEHIQNLIDQGYLHLFSSLAFGGEIVGLHQIYRNHDGYLSTRERDQVIKCKLCPICGKAVERGDRESEKDKEVIKLRTPPTLSWCGFCDKDVIPIAVPVARFRRGPHAYFYICPLCGGKISKHKARRLDDKVSGVIDRRSGWSNRGGYG
jgi:hypothetical protein